MKNNLMKACFSNKKTDNQNLTIYLGLKTGLISLIYKE